MHDTVALKIELPKIPDIELVAIEGLERLGRHLGITDEKVGEARVLVTEAIINALEHAGEENPVVQVEFTMSKQELTIFVRDYGKGFQPSAIQSPDIGKKFGSKDKRGWGLHLMKSMSDDFRIESKETGTKITLIKKLT
ncbi:MAG: ATP-binding protein [Bacteroidetes bacterium]|nr:ATP-binding protein [Bacteroidota bacterium]MCW5896440.1 ATP-binding protein [Bacteroidota bacterium]